MLNALIVDDEALARRGLAHRLRTIGGVRVCGEARNGREALEAIREEAPDLVFLDIQMPGMSGFDLVRELESGTMPSIVFVTAYDEYAVKAFEANALDYLLKPIEEDRLREALERVRERRKMKRAASHRRTLLKLVSDLSGEPVHSMREVRQKGVDRMKREAPKKLAIKDGSTTTWVEQQEIQWIDAAGDYMCVHAGGETLIMRKTMKELEDELDPEVLQRIHRSTIVNVNEVREMRSHINGEYFLTLNCGHTVKLSRTYKDKLRFFQG